MKKKLLLSNLGWLAITSLIIVHSCKSPATSGDGDNTGQQTVACVEDDVNFMNAQFFLDGIARYKKYQWNASNSTLRNTHGLSNDFEDARSCWYSLERLKNMICLTEKNAAKQGLTGELGIRFYYATYPDSTQQAVIVPTGNSTTGGLNILSTTASVSWRHTLFMVPTCYNSELKCAEDIFLQPLSYYHPNDEGVIKDRHVEQIFHPNWDVLLKNSGQPEYRIMILGQPAITTPSSKNQGMLCPPTCPAGVSTTLSRADAQKVN